ncbi:MAG: PH domain-containing protein [Patescibacteria group bacterium]
MFKSFLSIFSESTNAFEGIEKDEKVVLLVREHPLVIILKLLYLVPLAFIPILIGLFSTPFLIANQLLNLFLFLSSVYYLMLWQSLFYSLTMYTLDVWIVTDKRIIDSIQRGFFRRIVSELHLDRVQDTSVNTTGLFQTIFKFGDVEVQTAGRENWFKFEKVPHPERVKDAIMQAVEEKKQSSV